MAGLKERSQLAFSYGRDAGNALAIDVVRGPYVDLCVVGKGSKGLVESCLHFLGGAFKETSAAPVEERVTGENSFVVAILHEPADAVLCVARCIQRFDRDTANVEALAVCWSYCHSLAVLAANNRFFRELGVGQLMRGMPLATRLGDLGLSFYQLFVSSSMIPMAKTRELELTA